MRKYWLLPRSCIKHMAKCRWQTIKPSLQVSDKSCYSTTGFGEDFSLIVSTYKGLKDSRVQENDCEPSSLDPLNNRPLGP